MHKSVNLTRYGNMNQFKSNIKWTDNDKVLYISTIYPTHISKAGQDYQNEIALFSCTNCAKNIFKSLFTIHVFTILKHPVGVLIYFFLLLTESCK